MGTRTAKWILLGLLVAVCFAISKLSSDLPLYLRSRDAWKQNVASESIETPTNRKPNDSFAVNFTSVEVELQAALKKARDKIVIVNWYPPFGDLVQFDWLPYECGNCQVTLNRSKIDEPNAKAVVFHFNELSLSSMPQKRRLDQYYVWRSLESPVALRMRGMTLKEYDGVFNMTMTYRRDSDICGTEFSIPRIWERRGKKRLTDSDLDRFVNEKTGIALWVVSNCGTTKGAVDRMNYMKTLVKKFEEMELGGGCFGKPQKKYDFSKYKFYFALENSWNCRDYITEKFYYNGLINGAVPVVIGPSKAEYEAIAPPDSFIYAWDFETPKDLVKYLRYLDKNATAYKEYLKWTTLDLGEIPRHGRRTDWCQLCRVLHGINVDDLYKPDARSQLRDIPLFGHPDRPRIVTSLSRWFYGTENRECLFPNG